MSAIATAVAWARLAPLPSSARSVQVVVKGSMFSREFVVTFDASPPVIQSWLAASPGPSTAIRTVSGMTTTYSIAPGGGAEFAEVKVDNASGHIVVRTINRVGINKITLREDVVSIERAAHET